MNILAVIIIIFVHANRGNINIDFFFFSKNMTQKTESQALINTFSMLAANTGGDRSLVKKKYTIITGTLNKTYRRYNNNIIKLKKKKRIV